MFSHEFGLCPHVLFFILFFIIINNIGFTFLNLLLILFFLCYDIVEVWREFVWGAIAGAFGEGMMHPVDTIKTRIQSQAILNGIQV